MKELLLLARNENRQVPSLHLCAGPACALFCTGLDTGMVLDVGRSEAHVVAVYRGANLTSSYACEFGIGCWCRDDAAANGTHVI